MQVRWLVSVLQQSYAYLIPSGLHVRRRPQKNVSIELKESKGGLIESLACRLPGMAQRLRPPISFCRVHHQRGCTL